MKIQSLISGLLMTQTNNAFIVPAYNKPIVLKQNMAYQSDNELFQNIFDVNNNHTLSDNAIHSELNKHLRLKYIKHSQLLGVQENLLKSLLKRTNHFKEIKKLPDLLTKVIKKIHSKDSIIDANDTAIFKNYLETEKNPKNNIFINHNFISTFMNLENIDGHSPEIKKLSIKERVSDIFRETNFNYSYIKTNNFMQTKDDKIYFMNGGIIQGTYKNKRLYFLLSSTLDNQLRLVNMSQNIKNLGVDQHLQ